MKKPFRVEVPSRWFVKLRQRKLAKLARNGIVPDAPSEEIFEALRQTRPSATLEMFGALMMKVYRKKGTLWVCENLGLQSLRAVTTAFAAYLVDAMQDSANIAQFTWHDMGDDDTATSNAHTALQNSRESRANDTSPGENGTQQYQSIQSITATGSYTVNEHGIFNASSTGTMLDRNLVGSPPAVITDDVVEFTYELTVNAEAGGS